MNYCKRKNEPTDTVHCLNCEHCLPPGERTGGESGQRARRTLPEWFATLRDACLRQNTAMFFKQWGAWGADGVKRSKKENGCTLDGIEWKQYPGIIVR